MTTQSPPLTEPSLAWRAAAAQVVEQTAAALFSPAGRSALAYLADRGLSRETVMNAWLGYQSVEGEIAGLFVPAGIVIPTYVAGELWQIRVRRRQPVAGQAYATVRGGQVQLYGADRVAGDTCVVAADELDALTLHEHAGEVAPTVSLATDRTVLDPHVVTTLAGCAHLVTLATTAVVPLLGRQVLADRLTILRPLPGGCSLADLAALGLLADWLALEVDAVTLPQEPRHRTLPPPGYRCDRAGCRESSTEHDPEAGGWCLGHYPRWRLLEAACLHGWPELALDGTLLASQQAWQAFAAVVDEASIEPTTCRLWEEATP